MIRFNQKNYKYDLISNPHWPWLEYGHGDGEMALETKFLFPFKDTNIREWCYETTFVIPFKNIVSSLFRIFKGIF